MNKVLGWCWIGLALITTYLHFSGTDIPCSWIDVAFPCALLGLEFLGEKG